MLQVSLKGVESRVSSERSVISFRESHTRVMQFTKKPGVGVGGRDTLSWKPPEPLVLTALRNTDIIWEHRPPRFTGRLHAQETVHG